LDLVVVPVRRGRYTNLKQVECPKCGAENLLSAPFCIGCGHAFSKVADVTAAGLETPGDRDRETADGPTRAAVASEADDTEGEPQARLESDEQTDTSVDCGAYPQAGTALWGRFTVRKLVGRGGMGAVYLATDTLMNHRRVALKVLLPALVADHGARARLQREVESARDLRHPNVVAVHTYFEDETAIGYDMEYLEGATLQQHLDGEMPGSPFAGDADARRLAPVARLATAIASALDYIHAAPRSLVHRDVKPSNVMITPTASGRWDDFDVKLLDFGVVSVTRDTRLTGVAQPGTVAYMAPEVQEGSPSTAASDIYSFGRMIYLALTGVSPSYNLKPPSSLVHGLPEAADAPLLACFEPPAGRPGRASEVARALAPPTVDTAPRSPETPTTAAAVETTGSSLPRGALAIGGGLVLLALLFVFGRGLWSEERGSSSGQVDEPPWERSAGIREDAPVETSHARGVGEEPTLPEGPRTPSQPVPTQPEYRVEAGRLLANVEGLDYTVIDLKQRKPRDQFLDSDFLADDLSDSENLELEAVADFDGDSIDDALISLHPAWNYFGAGYEAHKYAFATYKGDGRFQVDGSFGAECSWEGKVVPHEKGNAVDVDCNDRVERYSCALGKPALVGRFDKPELTAVLEVTMDDLEDFEESQFPVDLNGDGNTESIVCSVRHIDMFCEIRESSGEQIPGTSWILRRLGVLATKTNGVSDLVLNSHDIVVWNGVKWVDK